MKRALIFSLLIVFGISVFAQVHGYLGSRFFVSANFSLTPDRKRYPLEYANDKRFTVHVPVSGEVNFVAGNGVSLGAKVTFTSVTGSFYKAYFDDNYYNFTGIADYKAKLFGLYLEGHSKNAYSVIDNYFRVGLSMASLKNTDYTYTDVDSDFPVQSNNFPDSVKSLAINQTAAMVGLYYEFGNRVPLSDHLLFYYGISGYVFPIRNVVHTYDYYPRISMRETDTYIRDLGKRRVANTNMLNLNFGLTWAF